jgi:peptide/nickel transport system permease protein
VGTSIVLIVVIPAITFFVSALIPGNAVDATLSLHAPPAQRLALEASLGLNKPVWDRYLIWFGHFLHGSLGNSYYTGTSVAQYLNSRLGVSLSLIIASTLLLSVVGIGLGVVSAAREGFLSRFVDVISISGLALPNFVLGVLLVEILAIRVHWFPATGYFSPSSPGQWLRSLALPVLTLAFAGVTAVAKQTRDQMKATLDQHYIRSLKANGVGRRSIIYRHALRNAAIPVVTVIGLVFVGALSGSVIVENIFVLPGLGSAVVSATSNRDIPIIQGVSVYFTLIVVAVNFLVDLAYLWLNPKTRTAKS